VSEVLLCYSDREKETVEINVAMERAELEKLVAAPDGHGYQATRDFHDGRKIHVVVSVHKDAIALTKERERMVEGAPS